jgi:hypothetical protein
MKKQMNFKNLWPLYVLLTAIGLWYLIRYLEFGGEEKRTTNFGKKHKGIVIGDHLKLWGGYNGMSDWSRLAKHIEGTVVNFIPSQNKGSAVVVKLDEQLVLKDATGNYVIMETRWQGQTWHEYGPVHLELCNFLPDSLPFERRKKGVWIEAASCYDFLN